MSAIPEMLAEYEANVKNMRARREALQAMRRQEAGYERRRKLSARIVFLDWAIADSQHAIWQMRQYIDGCSV